MGDERLSVDPERADALRRHARRPNHSRESFRRGVDRFCSELTRVLPCSQRRDSCRRATRAGNRWCARRSEQPRDSRNDISRKGAWGSDRPMGSMVGDSTAIGPLAGGWLVDASSWRFVFLSIIPFALVAAAIAFRHSTAGEPASKRTSGALDYAGAALGTFGLAGIVAALITGPESGFTSTFVLAIGGAGVAFLVTFVFVESRASNPLLPLDVFKVREFVGANLNTVLVYAALNGMFFLLMLQLQNGLGYSALVAGASLLPINALLLILSPRSGKLAERIGARLPMSIGSLVTGIGALLFIRVTRESSYVWTVLPAVLVFGVGLGMLVAPLTAVALGSLGEKRAGIASGVNNAAARLAGLLATASIPVAAGLGGSRQPQGEALAAAFIRAMMISAALCVAGAIVAFLMVRDGRGNRPQK